MVMSGQVIVYVGSYTQEIASDSGELRQGKGRGIYRFGLEADSGRLREAPLGVTTGVANPSFLAVDPRGRFLFAVNQLEDFDGQPTGTLSAFALEGPDGSLRFLNRQPTRGTRPCHVSVDRRGRFALVSNYGSGSLSVLPIRRGGELGPAVEFVQHHGSGEDKVRQRGPHVHSISLVHGDRHALVADLGLDRLLMYRFGRLRGRLMPLDRPWLVPRRGAGPRHLALHPDGRRAYLADELDSTVIVVEYGRDGSLRALQTCSTLPEGEGGGGTAADIRLHPSGKFLYVSNRGHDSIAVFAVEPGSGLLRPLGHEATQGRRPRGLAVDPSGRFLFVANQDSDTVVGFRIEADTGRLRPTGQVLDVPSPACVLPVLRG